MGGTGEVAIVGMACVMPGAADVETFWANIVDGVDAVTEVPSTRWDQARHYDPGYDSTARRAVDEPMSVSKWGGFVPDVGFDALGWGIPPASLASIDPAQLLALKCAAGALDDAGYGQGEGHRAFDRDRASVIYATGSGGAADLPAGFLLRLLLRSHGIPAEALPPELDAFLPRITEDGLPGVLTSVIAGRVANRLDLGGKNLTVDSACASVLVALDIACGELARGSSDLVLCGGVDLHNGMQDYVSFTAAHALSPTGRCRAFDVDADGMTLAEGVGCIVLKRLDDAERDGDRIYAVVRGVAGSSDGRHLGLTAPRQEGQMRAVRRAYEMTGISPADVGLVEAHGTGTSAGDRTELSTTTEIFAEAGVAPRSVVIGSVKSNVGHTKCASAIASLIKAAKAAYHGVLPPTLHVRQPNEVWDAATSPFVFLDRARPWLEERRLVGVSSFGFGGTNFHAILENHRPSAPAAAGPAGSSGSAGSGGSAGSTGGAVGAASAPSAASDLVGSYAGALPSGRPHWPSELFAFRAADDDEIDWRLDELAGRLADELAGPRQADRWRLRDLAASVGTTGEGHVRLAVVADDLDDLAAKVDAARARRAGRGVYVRSNVADNLPAAGRHGLRPGLAFLFPGAASARLGMAADVAVAFPPLRAAAAAGRRWVEAMWPEQAFGDAQAQQARLAEAAGPAVAVAGLTVAWALASLGVAPDRVAGLDHPLLTSTARAAAVCDTLRAAAHREPGEPPTGRPAETLTLPDAPGPAGVPPDAATARFLDEVRGLAEVGVRVFVEVGPGQALTRLVGVALADVPHLAVATDEDGEHGLTTLLHVLAQLAVAGIDVDLDALHEGRGSQPERWSDPPKRPGWIVNGHFARTAAGDSLPKGLRPATEAPVLHLADGEAQPEGPGAVAGPAAPAGLNGNTVPAAPGNGGSTALSDADLAVVTEYLRIIQGMITTGSQIVRGHVEAGQS